MQSLTSSQRMAGLDLARTIAIFGMFAAHVGDSRSPADGGQGIGLLAYTNGTAPAVFAVLVGIMTMMLAQGRTPGAVLGDGSLAFARWRIAVRGVGLLALGYLLDQLHTPIDIVLSNLGMMMVLSLVALRWRTWVLATSAVVLAWGGWFLTYWLEATATDLGIRHLWVAETLWSYHYPALAWMAYIFTGMALARLALDKGRIQAGLALIGGAAMVAALAVGLRFHGSPPTLPGRMGGHWAFLGSHSDTPIEMTLNIGFALVVIAASMWVAPRIARWIWPLLAVGAMSLTAYVLHVMVVWIGGDWMVRDPNNWVLLAFYVGITLFAAVWSRTVGDGPLERLLRWLSLVVARAATRHRQ